MVTTFIVLNALGRSLNIVMLAGLAFAVGTSLTTRSWCWRTSSAGDGKSRVQAALDGASEVWSAILASTLTNLAVFLPIILMKDEVGQLFRDIAIATSISTALSLGCALTIVPMMASRVLKTGRGISLPASAAHLDIVLLSWLGQACNGLVLVSPGCAMGWAAAGRGPWHDAGLTRPGALSDAAHRLPAKEEIAT